MPSRWAQVLIVLLWLVMTGWLVQRDVLPQLGYGELTYRSLLADRAIEEPIHWIIRLGGRRQGSVLTIIRPDKDGASILETRARLSSSLVSSNDAPSSTQILIDSDFTVDARGRLQKFVARLKVEGTDLAVDINGEVQGAQMIVQTSGLSILQSRMQFPVDPEVVMLDVFGPIDRLPNLRIGKIWTTRTIDPVSTLFSARNLFGAPEPSIALIRNQVVDTQAIAWNGEQWQCYVVEHRHESNIARTWARVRDGRVLRHEVPVSGLKVVLELDPVQEERN